MLSFAQLRRPVTRDEALETLRSLLSTLKFNSTSWQSGSAQLTILYLGAEIYSQLTKYVAALANAGLSATASGDALTALSDSHFDNQRVVRARAQGFCVLTLFNVGPGPYVLEAGGVVISDKRSLTIQQGGLYGPGDTVVTSTGPYTLKAGDVVQAKPQRIQIKGINSESTADGVTVKVTQEDSEMELPGISVTIEESVYEGPYEFGAGEVVAMTRSGTEMFRNLTPFALNSKSGAVTVLFEAEAPGAKGNVDNGAIDRFSTSISGVTISNPAIASTGTWLTRSGYDDETDARLHTRNRTKWTRFSVEATRNTLENVCLQAVPAIEKIDIGDQNPRGPGTVDIYVAGALTPVSGKDRDALQAVLNRRFLGNYPNEKGIHRVHVFAAPAAELKLTGIVYHNPDYIQETVRANVDDALEQYLRELPLGGSDYRPGPYHVAARNDIIQAIESAEGVRSVALNLPTADISVGDHTLMVPADYALEYRATLR